MGSEFGQKVTTAARECDHHQVGAAHCVLCPIGEFVDRTGLEGLDGVSPFPRMADDSGDPGSHGTPGDGAACGAEPDHGQGVRAHRSIVAGGGRVCN